MEKGYQCSPRSAVSRAKKRPTNIMTLWKCKTSNPRKREVRWKSGVNHMDAEEDQLTQEQKSTHKRTSNVQNDPLGDSVG